MLLLLLTLLVGANEIHARHETHRSALWNRADRDFTVAKQHWEETPTDPQQWAQRIGHETLGDPDKAVSGCPLNPADACAFDLEAREELVVPAPFGPEHLFDRRLEHFHPRFD